MMGLTQLGAPNLPVIVGLASLLLINRHETSVWGPAQSSRNEYAAYNNNNPEKFGAVTEGCDDTCSVVPMETDDSSLPGDAVA